MTTELREMLAAADGLPAACSAVVDHLLTRGFDLPSLYLEHAGRLRLHAQRGYWQVQDGFPTTAGIMGQVFTSGESVQVRVADAQHYVGAATGVVEELSVPIRLDGQVVGVLNIESRSALPSVAQRLLEDCGRQFAETLARLGPLEDSSAHQLVRHAVSLHALSTEAEIWRYTVEAGRGLSNMTAAVAVARDADGTPTVAAAAGPIGERLRQLTAATWTAISEWTAQGTSCYTVGDPAGSGFAGHTALRAAGAAAVIVVPIVVGERDRGLLVVADEASAAPSTSMIARLELLSIAVGSCLAMVEAMSQLHQRATRDPLTGLLNRTSLLAELEQWLVGPHRRRSDRLAVLFCDVDRFKDVNDSLGHGSGDHLLVEVAARLRSSLRPSDLLARFGGDEFVIVCDGVLDQDGAVAVAERLLAALAGPMLLDDAEVYVTASIGLAMAGTHPGGQGAITLVRDADTAMYEAKRRGRATVAVFCEDLRAQAAGRVATAAALRRAVASGQLLLHYQPIVSLPTGEIVGVEALLRWQRDGGQLLSATHFIQVAEDTGLIAEIGAWALQEACRQLAEWDAMPTGDSALQVAVNLSARQITDPALPDQVASTLNAAGIQPHRLVLEITESALTQDGDAAAEVLAALRKLGVKLAVDDFGSGFSSFAHRKRFPVDVLKIDRSFVSGLGVHREDTAIVAAVVGLAQALGLELVAEGVETDDQRDRLLALGCHRAQGYLFSRPVAADLWPGVVAALPRPRQD
ncbi:MAG: sensor domain-containing phosphodiesterase [Geodermatophilaceae bacterium]